MPGNRAPDRRELITLDQAAELLQVKTTKTVRRMINNGDITGYRIRKRAIRVDKNEVERIGNVLSIIEPGTLTP